MLLLAFLLIVHTLTPGMAALAAEEFIHLNMQASKEEVKPGEIFEYQISYDSSVREESFTDAQITLKLPELVEYVDAKADSNTEVSYNSDTRNVEFTFTDGKLEAGTSGQLTVKVKYPEDVTTATTATVSSTFKATIVTETSDGSTDGTDGGTDGTGGSTDGTDGGTDGTDGSTDGTDGSTDGTDGSTDGTEESTVTQSEDSPDSAADNQNDAADTEDQPQSNEDSQNNTLHSQEITQTEEEVTQNSNEVTVSLLTEETPTEPTNELIILQLKTDKTEADAGEVFTYKISYSASKLDSDFADPKLVLPLPAEVEYVGLTDSSIATGKYDSATHTITYTFKDNVLPAGSTGEITVKAKFPNYRTPNGTEATVHCWFEAVVKPGEPPAKQDSDEITVTSKSEVKWNLKKEKIRPIPDPVKGSEVEYEITLENTPAGNGQLGINDVIIVDTLPTGAEFVSASNGGTYDAGTGKVTWDLGDNITATKKVRIKVKYPEAFEGTEATNTADVTFVPIGGVELTDTASITLPFVEGGEDQGTDSHIWKRVNQYKNEVSPGQTVTFSIGGFENRTNKALTDAVITDMTPQTTASGKPIDFALQEVRTATFTGIDTYEVWYTETDNPGETDWSKLTDVSADSAMVLTKDDDFSRKNIHGLQFRFPTELPINFIQTANFSLTYLVPDDFPLTEGSDQVEQINNTATLTYKFEGTNKGPISKSATVDIVAKRPLIQLEKKANRTSAKPTDTITYTLRVKNHENSSDDLIAPTLTDVLSADLEFKAWRFKE
ncbi:MAG TPA: hypothetical protein VE710_13510, partial [Candidatus Bathyarchaeia archaeon]|nr:hypothetical protein [Candidatus Bathyarchaeia archaeon]